jgi:hypothetical protein
LNNIDISESINFPIKESIACRNPIFSYEILSNENSDLFEETDTSRSSDLDGNNFLVESEDISNELESSDEIEEDREGKSHEEEWDGNTIISFDHEEREKEKSEKKTESEKEHKPDDLPDCPLHSPFYRASSAPKPNIKLKQDAAFRNSVQLCFEYNYDFCSEN